jgi:hypothetical protein
MLVRLFAFVGLIVTTAFAGWERRIVGTKGSFNDSPPPHSLSYFQIDPCLRPDSDSLSRALECTWKGAPPPSPAERERRANTHTNLVEVGKIGEFTIYDLWYSRNGPNLDPDVRSVLVKIATDQYQEIDVHIHSGVMFPVSEIVRLSGEPILIAKSHDGGNHDRIDEALYVFRPSGPEPPDFRAVDRAATELVPANMSIRTTTNNYESMTRVVETYRNDLNLPPVSVAERGRITVTYRFVDGRALVTSAKYERYSLE